MARRQPDQRSGLLLIACALLVITVTVNVLFHWQSQNHLQRSRAQGSSLARLLSSMPDEAVLPSASSLGALRVVRRSQSDPAFAYVVAVGLRGEPLAQEVMPGVVVPETPPAHAPDQWVGERHHETASMLEFHAPLLRAGQRVGEIRVGYHTPTPSMLLENSAWLGALALPIFLLAPLAYLLIRREVVPVGDAVARLDSALGGQSLQPVDVPSGGEVAMFAESYNRFVELVQDRMTALESERADMHVSSRVIGYQKSRIEAVLDALPDAAVVFDEKGVVAFANTRLEQVLGVAPEAAIGRKLEAWCPVPELVELLTQYPTPAGFGPSSERLEFAPPWSEEARIAASTHPLMAADEPANARGSVLLLRDVTAISVARNAQELFIAHVSHELKSPLNVIGMYSEALLGPDGGEPGFRRDACNTIRDEVERVANLVDSLLTVSRIESGMVLLQRQRIRLEQFLRDVLDTSARLSIAAGLEFSLDIQCDVPVIHADKELLRIALNNLLTNAIKYNRENGKVELSVEETTDELSISVSDTGLGISEDERRRVFEKFFRSDDPEVQQRGGHGLGLTLVSEVAALHGGEVTVESSPGVGSRFSMLLRKSAALIPGERDE